MNETKKHSGIPNRHSLPVSIPLRHFRQPRATLCPIDFTKPKSLEKVPILETTTDYKKDSEAVEKKSEEEKKIPKKMENIKQINSKAKNGGELRPTKISKETNTDEWVASPEIHKKFRFPIHQDLCNSLDTIMHYIEQKTPVHLSEGTQTDDDNNLSSEEYAEYKEFKKNRETNSKKASVTNFLKEFTDFGQQFRQFFTDVYTSCQTLFKENVGDDNRLYVCTNEKRRIFMNIIQDMMKLMKMKDEVMEPFIEDSNNKNEQTPIQDPVYQVDSLQEQMKIITDHQTSMDQDFMIGTVGSDVLEPKEQQVQNDIHESENQFVPLQQSNVLYAQSNVNNNNLFNAHQNTRQFLISPRPLFEQQQPQLLQQQQQLLQQQQQQQLPQQQQQLPQQPPQLPHKQSQLLQQLPHQQPVNLLQQRVHPNSGIFYGHQNKIYRYPGRSNNRATPFYQKSQKKRMWQQQQDPTEPMMQTPPNQPLYYQANAQQLLQQQMHYP